MMLYSSTHMATTHMATGGVKRLTRHHRFESQLVRQTSLMSNNGLWNRRFVVSCVGDIGVRHDVNHVTVLCRDDADVVICIEMDQAISGAKTQTRLQWHTHT